MPQEKPTRLLTKYETVETTIANGVTNTEISFGAIAEAWALMISNDGTGSISARINGTSNDAITIRAGEVLRFDEFKVTSLYLSNASGATQAYRIAIVGY